MQLLVLHSIIIFHISTPRDFSAGFTQTELAERVGTIQALVSDYEPDKLRLSAEMAIRFATALELT